MKISHYFQYCRGKLQRSPASSRECRRNRVRRPHSKPLPAGNSCLERTILCKLRLRPPQAVCTGERLLGFHLDPVAKRIRTVDEQQNQMPFTVQLRPPNCHSCLNFGSGAVARLAEVRSASGNLMRPVVKPTPVLPASVSEEKIVFINLNLFSILAQ